MLTRNPNFTDVSDAKNSFLNLSSNTWNCASVSIKSTSTMNIEVKG